MKKVLTFILVGFASMCFMAGVYAQSITIDGVFRPRFENRHGYKTIFPEHAQAASFISQRSRLNFNFANDDFKVGFGIQNVGVWGETGTLSKLDIYGTAVHEAWGEILFSEIFSLKAGRQEIIYDDHRIFGSVNWTQQGRSHDAAIFKIKPNESNSIDIGFAYNALGESLYKQNYMTNNYKAFQYAHWHGKFGKFGLSVLALNNGMPYINQNDKTGAGVAKENIAYSQTIGPRLSYNNDVIKANLTFYGQFGENALIDPSGPHTSIDVSATYFGIDFHYSIGKTFTIGAGMEYLSGNDEKEIADNGGIKETEKAFAPLYGTNHKFNGWMDYFYVGNHFNSVGLVDIYIPLKFKKDKFTARLIPHFFSSAATLYRPKKDENFQDLAEMKDYSKRLGTEIDIEVSYAVAKGMLVKAGYSMMFASETMEVLKGTQKDKNNTWGWVMLVFKPTFYQNM